MNREEVNSALAKLDSLGRDVAERVVIGLSRGSCDYPQLPQLRTPFNIARALGEGYSDVVVRLDQLHAAGLIREDGDDWVWAAGPISDFFETRIATNFA